jgi:methylenetetrahydrofolate--tRNA-(uracil-5-)-methyltransferase
MILDMEKPVTIVGAGLAGCEAAHYLANHGVRVRLYEMRPEVTNGVHVGDGCAELVCSNSLRSDDPLHPVGLLKREMACFGSLVMEAARKTAVPAGGALAVDREQFSSYMTRRMEEHPLIDLVRKEVTDIPGEPAIIAAGPLCSAALTEPLFKRLGDSSLYFYDAIAPVLEFDSLDLNQLFFQSRYNKGNPEDYLNIPLTKEDYLAFHHELVSAEKVKPKLHEKMKYFEGCLPIEVMAQRGVDTLRFGPMKPVGLTNAHAPDDKPYAVVQLRRDNALGTLYNIVGFQTKMKYGAQTEVFKMIPGLENASFARLGGIHRNTFLNSPTLLDNQMRLHSRPHIRFAGQITGVEGYVESAAMGLLAGRLAAMEILGQPATTPPQDSAMGALIHHITGGAEAKTFQPMNVNFGLFRPVEGLKAGRRGRKDRYKAYTDRAKAAWSDWLAHATLDGA